MMFEAILSIQSAVAMGHVGNSAAVLPLQRMGFEVWPVNTVLFSNHTGYGAWRGRAVELAWVEEVLQGIEERGAFTACRALLSGYLGAPELGQALQSVLTRIRAVRPDALYACDPVMGDVDRGFFVKPGIPEIFADQLVPEADIITPNAFELGHLAGQPIVSVASACAAAATLRARGPKIVVCTSVLVPERDGALGVLCDTEAGSWMVWTPRLDVALNGTGDTFTALFLGAWLRTGDAAKAVEHAASAMYALVDATQAAGSRELVQVAAQEVFAVPPEIFPAERVR